MDIIFKVLATLVAMEHIYIMCLETFFTHSARTALTFNMDREELQRTSVTTLFRNQGIYNFLLAVLILISVWVVDDLFWSCVFLTYVVLVAVYDGVTSNVRIIFKQGGLAFLALLYSFFFL